MPINIVSPINWTSLLNPNTNYLGLSAGNFAVQNAGKAYSFIAVDANTMRFEVRSGDVWSAIDPASKERSELCGVTKFYNGTAVDISYQFMLEPGAKNTADWSVFGQLHADDSLGTSPPFAINLGGNDNQKMVIFIGYSDANGKAAYKPVYVDSSDLQRGHYYSFDIKIDFLGNGQGTLQVTRDGVQIVNYAGAMGLPGQTYTYWKEGIYRSASKETLAADYKNLTITTSTPGTANGANASGSTTTTPKPPLVTVSTLEKPPLAVTVTSTLSKDTGPSAIDGVTSNGQGVLNGTTTGGAAIAVFDGKTQIGATTASSNGTWSFPYKLPEGAHSLSVKAALGAATATAAVKTAIVVDTIAPKPPVMGLAGVDKSPSAVVSTHDGHLVFAGAAEPGATVQLFGAQGLLGTTTADSKGAWTFDPGKTFADGHYTFYGKAVDLAGNVSQTSAYFYTDVDTVAPSPTVQGGAQAAGITTLQGFSESGSTLVLSDHGKVVTSTLVGSNGVWTASVAGDGAAHSYEIFSTDAAGNTSAVHSLIVGTDGADTLVAHQAGDFMLGGRGGDVFVFDTANAQGSTVLDFQSKVDKIEFTGFIAGQASVTQIDSTHWQVSDHVHTETFTLGNGATLHAGDYFFG